MSLDALYSRQIEANYLRRVARQDAPAQQSFSLWSFGAAGIGGVPAGLLEVAGSGADVLSPAERASRRAPRPVVLRDQPPPRETDFALGGDPFRAKAAEFAPDPQTAHVADQLLFGLTRVGTKAAAAFTAAGPVAGSALLGAEEANTTYRGLLNKGIDPDTAALVGGVTGLTTGLTVGLPVSAVGLPLSMTGKVGATAGLVAVGGPGAYIAQETAARELLAGAGYETEAATHDPYDPLALAVSTILPGGFGAWALRNAARQSRITAPRTEAQAIEAARLSPEEQARSDAFERSDANLAQLRSAIKAEKDPANRAILEDELRTQEAAAQAAARQPAPVADQATLDAARVVQVERALTNNLPEAPGSREAVLKAVDELAAGRFPEIPPAITRDQYEANFKAWFGDSKVVDESGAPRVMYRGTANADGAAYGGGWVYLTDDPAFASMYANKEGGAVLPVYARAENIIDAGRGQGLELFKQFNAERGRQWFDGATSTKTGAHVDWQTAPEFQRWLDARGVEYDGIRVAESNGASSLAVRSEQQLKSAIGNSGRFDPTSGSLTDPLPETPAPRAAEAEATAFREDPEPAEPAAADTAAQPAEPAPRGQPRDLRAELIELRKAQSLLRSLLECVS